MILLHKREAITVGELMEKLSTVDPNCKLIVVREDPEHTLKAHEWFAPVTLVIHDKHTGADTVCIVGHSTLNISPNSSTIR